MSDVYPVSLETNEIEKLNKETVAVDCIEAMNSGLTKAQAIGPILNGSDDVATFNEVWSDVLAEGKAMRAISITDKTEAKYKSALGECCNYLDSEKWYNGLLLENGVESFNDLKSLYKVD